MTKLNRIWLLASALLIAPACSDDDGGRDDNNDDDVADTGTGTPGTDAQVSRDGGSDAAKDASDIDSSQPGTDIDATMPNEAGPGTSQPDGSTAPDAGPDAATTDARVGVDSGLDSGTDAGQDSGARDPIAINGTWFAQYGVFGGEPAVGEEEITQDTFSFYKLIDYDNTSRVAYGQSPADDQYNPDKYNKNVWTPVAEDGSFYYCTVAFGFNTLAEARASTATADATNPDTGGCGGSFPWTKLSPPNELVGAWKAGGDNYEVTVTKFGPYSIVSYDNEANEGIVVRTRAATDGGMGTKLWSKVEWTEPANDAFYVCYVEDDLASYDQVLASTATADRNNLTTGCDGGPWVPVSK